MSNAAELRGGRIKSPVRRCVLNVPTHSPRDSSLTHPLRLSTEMPKDGWCHRGEIGTIIIMIDRPFVCLIFN